MFEEALHPKTKQILTRLVPVLNCAVFNGFYLAGGTALALQFGHRKSVDLDFFCKNEFDTKQIKNTLLKIDLKAKVLQETSGTLDLLVNNVKVSFLYYPYPLLDKYLDYDGVNIASIVDIACMKLSAISSRGTKKDLFDIYEILQLVSIDRLVRLFKEKYNGIDYSFTHILKSITFFEDAEKDPDPQMIKAVTWQNVKSGLIKLTTVVAHKRLGYKPKR